MNTRLRDRRAAARPVSRIRPADPTNGRPDASSDRPGASPMKKRGAPTGPSPGTACVRPTWSRHNVHERTRSAIRVKSSARWTRSATSRQDPGGHKVFAASGPHLGPQVREVSDLRLDLLDLRLELRPPLLEPLLRLESVDRRLLEGLLSPPNLRPVPGLDAAEAFQLPFDLLSGWDADPPDGRPGRSALTTGPASGRSRRRGRHWYTCTSGCRGPRRRAGRRG